MNKHKVTFRNPSHDLDFQLSIPGYEFPEIKTGLSANWLIVRARTRYKALRSCVDFPALCAQELGDIADWFETISRNDIPRFVTAGFIEPNLEFELLANRGDKVRFGIRLSHEFKPPFRIEELAIDDQVEEDDPFVMVFEYGFEEMRSFAGCFRGLLDSYPRRGEI